MRSSLLLTTVALGGFLAAGFFVHVQPGEAAAKAELENDDCVKCHQPLVQQINEAGAKHKTEVACLECHAGPHPPAEGEGSIIPQCSSCHEGEAHFTLENCLDCHTNPHQPLNISLEGEVKSACQTCHPGVVKEVDTFTSAHAEVDCSFCHDKHGYKPDCLDCHEPHAEGQKFADCVQCHRAHQPLTLTYGTDVPNKDCGACHGDVKTTLESGSSKHAGFQCVFCHAEKHAVIPECQDCHGVPHNKQMLGKFDSCNACHQNAHDLLK